MNRLFAAALLLALAVPAALTPAAHAQAVPTTISYQGVLTDASGNPVPNGTYAVTLRLFPAAVGGSATYAESHTVATVGGVFAAELGAGTPTTGTWANVAFDQGFWLETAVGGTTLSPRTKLLAGPYARSLTPGARVTGTVSGIGGSVIRAENTAATGTNYGLLALSASTGGRGLYASASATTGTNTGVYGVSASTAGRGVYGEASAQTGTTVGVYGHAVSTTGTGVYGYTSGGVNETNYGVHGRSDSRSGRGVYGEAPTTTGTTYGVYGTVASTSGRGVFGEATAASGTTTGGYFESASTSGRGVYGVALASSGETFGGYFRNLSSDGRAVHGSAQANSGTTYGGFFRSASTSGRGVFGEATASSGTTFGVRGESASVNGRGVYGEASAATGTTYGGYFLNASTTGNGVYGNATATTGVNFGVRGASASTSGRGVYGQATATSGTTYGVFGTTASTTGRAVYGSATATSGTNYGLFGTTGSPQGYGLYATNPAGGLAARFAGRTRFDDNMEFYDGTDLRILLDVDEGGEAPSIKLRRGGANVIELDAEHNGRARVITQELEITGGSDLAEHFDVAPLAGLGAPAPGMVVAIDPAWPGRLTVAATPYDPLVAGVVSGAGGVRPGFLMGQDGSIASGDTPVALVGRVYVLVDASYGAVRPGDLLTTSATPGHAMRASDRARAQGAVLGKAMTGLESGRGLVLVLVGLQ